MKKRPSSPQEASVFEEVLESRFAFFRLVKKGLGRAFSSLRQRNYRFYWSGQLVSVMGSSMQAIGQAWLVFKLTHSPLLLGLMGALQALPVLLFSIFGGVFADRWPKRRVLLLTQGVEMILAFLLWALVATSTIQLWHIYLLAFVLGIAITLDKPARQSFVIELVGRNDLPNAVALNSSLFNLARIVGPGLGGIIIAASSTTMLFLLNALSFFAAIAGLLLIEKRTLYTQEREMPGKDGQKKTWQSLHEGVIYVCKTPAILLIILVVGLVLLFGSNFTVVLPLFATNILHVGASGFGFLSAAAGAGALFSTLWQAWDNRQPTLRGILLGTLVFGVLEVAFAFSQIYFLSLVLIASIGFAEFVFAMLAITALQTAAPDHLRGRVMSVYILFFDGSLPLGYLFTGWLAGLYGAPIALLIGALLVLLVAGAGWTWKKTAEKNFVEATLRSRL